MAARLEPLRASARHQSLLPFIAKADWPDAEALAISNTEIVKELALPPVKIHCSVLAEDAIRAAIGDWKKKNSLPEQAAPQHDLVGAAN